MYKPHSHRIPCVNATQDNARRRVTRFSFYAASQMQSSATDGVAWSVCQSVGLSRSWALQKRLDRSRCRLECELRWAQGTMYWMEVQIPTREGGNFEGKKGPAHGHSRTCLPVDIFKSTQQRAHRYGAAAYWTY